MIGLIQRVSQAEVQVANSVIASIDRGLLVLVGVEKTDTLSTVQWLAKRLLGYRVFPDTAGKMNLSVADIAGALLVVPQFTLAADTTRGLRPSFSSAAEPTLGQSRFAELLTCLQSTDLVVQAGRFGADMQVSLINDGPVTFYLQSSRQS